VRSVRLQVSGGSPVSEQRSELQLSPGQARVFQVAPGQTLRITSGSDSLDPGALQEIQKVVQLLLTEGGKVIQLEPGTSQVIEIEPGKTMRVRLQGASGGKGPQIVTERAAAADSVKADSTAKGSKTPERVAPPSR
jgi:hypothetical protein